LLDGGGIFVAPRDQGALERAMHTLLTEPETRARMGARARERAGQLDWAAAARAALGALREAAA
jgi:glycosyltransferase involved in cell wall biosynthesis